MNLFKSLLKRDCIRRYKLSKNQDWHIAEYVNEYEEYCFKTFFIYITKNGLEQTTTANVTLDRITYKPKWCDKHRLNILNRHMYIVDVKFTVPVGERLNDWEGGTYSTSFQIDDEYAKIFDTCVDFNILLPKILKKKFIDWNERHCL